MLTQAELKRVLSYDPATGIFIWIVARGRVSAGTIAGRVLIDRSDNLERRYVVITVNSRKYRAHRLAWLYVYGAWPDHGLDHRDTDGTNNRIDNLREATATENAQNMRRHAKNSSGIKGVFWNSDKGKWTVRIRVRGRNKHIGHFEDIDRAADAYQTAATQEFGEFARVA